MTTRHIDDYSPGHKLPNGAILIDKTKVLPDTWVVLGIDARDGSFHPFCTWRCDAEANTWHGHYLQTLWEASRDYNQRIELPSRRSTVIRSAA